MGGSMKLTSHRFRTIFAGASLLAATNPALADCASGDLSGDWLLYATVITSSTPFTARCPVTISVASQSPPTYSMVGSNTGCKTESATAFNDFQIDAQGSLTETKGCKFGGSFVLGAMNMIIGTVDIVNARIESDGSNTMKTHISGIGRQKGDT